MYPWDSYAEKVLSGDIVVGKYVRLAVERYKEDLQRVGDEDFPYYFDESKAAAVIAFFPAALRHSIGEHAGDPFHLEEWQAFAIANIFGWQRTDGRGRRFRRIYWSMGRKQGKSTIAAGIAMFVASCDMAAI